MAEVRIDFLKNHPERISLCAQWSYNELGHYTPERTLEDFIASRKAYAEHDDRLPITLVAFYQDKPVGMCSLSKTRGILPELTPWLAALYVEPEYRNKGIGSLLEQEIGNFAQKLGYQNMYCFTSDRSVVTWYEKQGWRVKQTSWLHNHEVVVLEKSLEAS